MYYDFYIFFTVAVLIILKKSELKKTLLLLGTCKSSIEVRIEAQTTQNGTHIGLCIITIEIAGLLLSF